MLGFQLDIGKKSVQVKIEQRCVSIILEKVNDVFFLKFSGTDFTKNQSMVWYESEFTNKDAFDVRIKSIEEESVPVKIKSISQTEQLADTEEKRQNDKNILRYRLLREELLRRKLISE